MTTVNNDFDPSKFVASYLVRNRLLHGIEKYSIYLDGKMLDFGCGSKPYKSLFNVSEYVGLDFHSDGHDHATEQIDFFYDGITIPFPNEIFDSVFSSEVFEHVFNLEHILHEINRVMKKGGFILITCPFAICEHEQPNDYARYTSFAIKHLMEKNDFEIIAFEKLGTSIDVIVQMRLTYFHNNIMPLISWIPVFRHIVRIFVNFILNSYANIHGKIFPRGNELYLNNLILCKKR